MSIRDKVALLTGAGGGIGRAIAKSLAKEKVSLILFGGNNLEKLNETEKIVKSYGANCLVLPGNLTDKSFIVDGVKKAIDVFGKIDILINNAGKGVNYSFENTTEEIFDEIMNINVKAPFMLTKECLPYLRNSSFATIVNIASVTAHVGYENQSAYSASKHALLGMTRALAKEVYKEGIRVHAVSPGGVYTDMIKITRPDLTPDGMIMPEDVADIVMFFITHRTNAVIDEIELHRATKQPF